LGLPKEGRFGEEEKKLLNKILGRMGGVVGDFVVENHRLCFDTS
jgi:hypothetical protein